MATESTLIQTPATSAKTLQLTSIWEQVVRNKRVPADVGLSEVLREIRGRLRAGEWQVRQHALRVLADVLTVSGPIDDPFDLQAALICNLGSPAPGVRKATRDALSQLLQHSHNPEQMLLDILGGCNDENITLGITVAVPDLLTPFIFPRNGGYVLSTRALTIILTYLVNKVHIPIYQRASIDALLKIRDMCGDVRFNKCLSDISPDPDTIQLLALNLDDSGVDLKLPHQPFYQKFENSSSDFSDGDAEDNTTHKATDYYDCHQYPVNISNSEEVVSDGSEDTYTMESPGSGKIVLETEIKLSDERAITMRIMEEDNIDVEEGCDDRFVSADGALVMSVIPSSDEDAGKRTPRRVRFGGEVIKLCTPESDSTDVRIEIRSSTGHQVDQLIIENEPKPSLIPLPVSPATTVPHASHTSFFHNREEQSTTQPSSDVPARMPSIKIESVETNNENSSINSQSLNDSSTEASQPLPNSSPESSSLLPHTDDTVSLKDASLSDSHVMSSSRAAVELPPPEPMPFADLWSWQQLNLLSDNEISILKEKGNWKDEFRILEHLNETLGDNINEEKLRTANIDLLRSLLSYLLESTSSQSALASLSIVGKVLKLVQSQSIVDILVPGLCRHVGGSSTISHKLAAADLLRSLFSYQPPSNILPVLLGERCLRSTSSKMRENSLLVLLDVLMTFPSTTLPLQLVLEETCRRAADPRRRVRHAALETLAVLTQFLPPNDILQCASKFGSSHLAAAVSCRLTRRILPSVSPDGLILYALQIPPSRRLGHTGPPQGADVEWILAGTGSLSTGSARSRGQLYAAHPAPSHWAGETAHSTFSQWRTESHPARIPATDNPWTAQKHRNEEVSPWTVTSPDADEGFGDQEGGSVSGLRPYYVRLTGADDTFRSHRYALHRVADAGAVQPSIRILTPSALRKHANSKPSPWTEARNRDTETIELKRMERVTGRKVSEVHQTMLLSNSPVYHQTSTPPSALLLPSINSPEKYHHSSGRSHTSSVIEGTAPSSPVAINKTVPRQYESTLPAKLTEFATTRESLSQSLPVVTRTLGSTSPIHTTDPVFNNGPQDPLFRKIERDGNERAAMASAPAVVTTNVTTAQDRDAPSSSSSQSSGSLLPTVASVATPSVATDPGPLEVSSLQYQKVKTRRKLMSTANGQTGKVSPNDATPVAPTKPFERPKEAMDTCFNQLEAHQWEVTVQGLSSLTRLVRHHPTLVASHIHTVAACLSRHIRNLRSQVSRAACVVAADLFTTLKRTMDPELDEIAGALFHRVADTNRFIRQDSNAGLDALVDNILPQRSIPVILTKGAAHQNAVVRTAVARLFLRITERIGPERVLTLPKDIRDKMLKASAGLLTEGRQETRSFAKQLFRVWSIYPEYNNIILEAIPSNVMRHISKTLASLRV